MPISGVWDWKTAALLVIVLVVGCSSPQARDDGVAVADSLPRTIVYSDTSVTLYWCGHRMRSPLNLELQGDALSINGIAPKETPYHLSPQIKALVRRSPAGRALLRLEASPELALDHLVHRSDSSLYVAVREYRASHSRAAAITHLDAAVLDTGAIRMSDDGAIVSLMGANYSYQPHDSDTLPFEKFEHMKAESQRAMHAGAPQRIADELRTLLVQTDHALLIVNQGGVFMVTGDRALEAERYLDLSEMVPTTTVQPPPWLPRTQLAEIRDVRRAEAH
jgi:hypothetical protein